MPVHKRRFFDECGSECSVCKGLGGLFAFGDDEFERFFEVIGGETSCCGKRGHEEAFARNGARRLDKFLLLQV